MKKHLMIVAASLFLLAQPLWANPDQRRAECERMAQEDLIPSEDLAEYIDFCVSDSSQNGSQDLESDGYDWNQEGVEEDAQHPEEDS